MAKREPLRDDLEHVLQLLRTNSMKKTAQILSIEKGFEITHHQVRCLLRKNHVYIHRNAEERTKVFTQHEPIPDGFHDYLSSICYGRSRKEIVEMCCEKFGREFTLNQVVGYMKRHKLTTGRTGYIPPGGDWRTEKANKAWHGVNSGCFKKGIVPHNQAQVGEERLTVDGYTWVKIAENPKAKKRDNWKMKHQLIWEKYNGPIPEGMVITFLDGNKQNFDINNLMAITPELHSLLNIKKMRTNDTELTRSSAALGELILKISEKEKEKHEQHSKAEEGQK